MAPAKHPRHDEHHRRQMQQLAQPETHDVQGYAQVASLIDGFVDLTI